MFQKAVRSQKKLRMALDGPAGSGKTLTALRFAMALAAEGKNKVALIDTECGSASLYAGDTYDDRKVDFDVVNLDTHSPSTYTEAIRAAGKHGYDVIVIDSLSHAWNGIDGALDLVSGNGNQFTAWKTVTPMHNEMIDAILRSPCHVIVTMRTKTEYVIEQNTKGKMEPKKIGTKAIQRDGVEYEFDVVGDIDLTHTLAITKSRCSLIDGKVVTKPGATFIAEVLRWLSSATGANAPTLEQEVARIKACATSDDLKKLWTSDQRLADFLRQNPEHKQAIIAAKDDRKAELDKPQTPVTPTPVAPAPVEEHQDDSEFETPLE